jgi:hypothetical protein
MRPETFAVLLTSKFVNSHGDSRVVRCHGVTTPAQVLWLRPCRTTKHNGI